MTFWKLLNKAEKRHLKEASVINVAGFLRTREEQIRQERNSDQTSCYECTAIARKVGLAGSINSIDGRKGENENQNSRAGKETPTGEGSRIDDRGGFPSGSQ